MFDRSSLSLPAICAPMFFVTGPDLVREACLAGLVGVIPRHNARTLEQFEGWLEAIQAARREALARSVKVGPLVVNVGAKLSAAEINDTLQLAAGYGIETVISVGGGPREVVRIAHSKSMGVLHDVIRLDFAKKAIDQGVDGLIAIGSGGGGHSGLLSHLALIEKIRTTFKGPLVMAGGISTGAGCAERRFWAPTMPTWGRASSRRRKPMRLPSTSRCSSIRPRKTWSTRPTSPAFRRTG